MAAVNVSKLLRYTWEDKVEDLKAAIVEGGVLKKEIKLQKDARGDPLLATLLRIACNMNATSVVKFLASIVDRNVLNCAGEVRWRAHTGQYKTVYGSALHAATDRGSVKCLQYLLDAGADTNVTDVVRKPVIS
ncbi:uncharacterized protein LOC135825370 [Sycon ciliatum]|uniref:uncharacterized protein LOC135825370 n=1 Tax=Sycon ciliatum TaxID=27933 RepID=UPI0031F663B0